MGICRCIHKERGGVHLCLTGFAQRLQQRLYIHIYICIYTHTHTYIYIEGMEICRCIHKERGRCTCACPASRSASSNAYIYIHTHTHTHTHIYIYIYIYIYTYIEGMEICRCTHKERGRCTSAFARYCYYQYCMVYSIQTGGRKGSLILCNNHAIVLHQGGPCRWAWGMKGWLIRAQ